VGEHLPASGWFTIPAKAGPDNLCESRSLAGTRMRGGVGAGGEKPPATQLAKDYLTVYFIFY